MMTSIETETELSDNSVTEWTLSKLSTDHLIASVKLLEHTTIVSKPKEGLVYCKSCKFASEKNVISSKTQSRF